MAGTIAFRGFPNFIFMQTSRVINFEADNIRAALLSESWTPNAVTDDVWSDVSSFEITAQADYVRQTLSGKDIVLDGANTAFIASPVNFGNNVTLTAKYVVLFVDVAGPDSGKPLLGYFDLNSAGSTPVGSINQLFQIEFDPTGFYKVQPYVAGP